MEGRVCDSYSHEIRKRRIKGDKYVIEDINLLAVAI
jgi:hypothetical protein